MLWVTAMKFTPGHNTEHPNQNQCREIGFHIETDRTPVIEAWTSSSYAHSGNRWATEIVKFIPNFVFSIENSAINVMCMITQ